MFSTMKPTLRTKGSTTRLRLPAKRSSSRRRRILMLIRRTCEEASWSPSPTPARVPQQATHRIHLAPVAMVEKARTSPRNHAKPRLPGGGKTRVLGQDATKMTCPLLRQEETTVEVGEITIRQGVAEAVRTLHRQDEAGTAHALRHLRLGGRRRVLADNNPGNPGPRRMSRMPTGMRDSSIRQTHDIASTTYTPQRMTLTSAPCVLDQQCATCKSLGI